MMLLRWLMHEKPKDWVRPMDLGAGDASWHSGRLRRLAKIGLVDQRERHGLAWCFSGPRGSYEYRINKKGREFFFDRNEKTVRT